MGALPLNSQNGRGPQTDYNEYAAHVGQASELVESGDYDRATEILEKLVASDISDVDKSMMCLNIATVFEKMGRIEDALAWYERGEEYERHHDRHYVAEQRAVYLADKGRDVESLSSYEELLLRHGLTEEDKERIRSNIELLRRRTSEEKSD